MPKGQAYDFEAFKNLAETEVKKESETTRTSLFTPAAGKRFRLAGFSIYSTAETVVSLEDAETVFYVFGIAAKANIIVNWLPSGYLSTGAAQKLQFKTSNTAKFSGTFYGIEDVS